MVCLILYMCNNKLNIKTFPIRGISNFNTLKERPPLWTSNGISGEMANDVNF